MQLHELEAWLGDDHGLTEGQIEDLLSQVDDMEDRYDGDEDEIREALVAAHRILIGDSDVVAELAERRVQAIVAESSALAGLQQAAIMLIGSGAATEAGFARLANVDRMTVRKWLGKK
jgi:hypothetical protein